MHVKNKDTIDSCFKKKKSQLKFSGDTLGLIFTDEKASHATQCNTFSKRLKLACLFQVIIKKSYEQIQRRQMLYSDEFSNS